MLRLSVRRCHNILIKWISRWPYHIKVILKSNITSNTHKNKKKTEQSIYWPKCARKYHTTVYLVHNWNYYKWQWKHTNQLRIIHVFGFFFVVLGWLIFTYPNSNNIVTISLSLICFIFLLFLLYLSSVTHKIYSMQFNAQFMKHHNHTHLRDAVLAKPQNTIMTGKKSVHSVFVRMKSTVYICYVG